MPSNRTSGASLKIVDLPVSLRIKRSLQGVFLSLGPVLVRLCTLKRKWCGHRSGVFPNNAVSDRLVLA